MAKKKHIKFAVFCNQMIGHIRKAPSVAEVIEALPKRVQTYWSSIKYKDEEGRTICITKEYLEEQGMTIAEVIQDHLQYGDTDDNIMVLNPKGRGTIYL